MFVDDQQMGKMDCRIASRMACRWLVDGLLGHDLVDLVVMVGTWT